jgi:hypothetical protein
MIIVVEGSKTFNNYDIFMRGMGVALSDITDSNIFVLSMGPHKINSFTASFCNSSENFLKQKGYKIKFSKISKQWFTENIDTINHFAYFCNPNEKNSSSLALAELQDIDVKIYRY